MSKILRPQKITFTLKAIKIPQIKARDTANYLHFRDIKKFAI